MTLKGVEGREDACHDELTLYDLDDEVVCSGTGGSGAGPRKQSDNRNIDRYCFMAVLMYVCVYM